MTFSETIDICAQQGELIKADRQTELQDLARLIKTELEEHNYIDIIAICTHNSRRSQLLELWLKVISIYFDLNGIFSYSGGTESTAFNPRMVKGLEQAGFNFDIIDQSENPVYIPISDYLGYEQSMFSKVYDHSYNPSKDYTALMVCDHADQNCPIVKGAKHRFSLPYIDPKRSDDSPEEAETYLNTIKEIGREMIFLGKLITEKN